MRMERQRGSVDSSLAQILAALEFASSVQWDRSGLGGCSHGIICSLRSLPLATFLHGPHDAQLELPSHSLLWDYTGNTTLRTDRVEPSQLQL